LNHPLLNAPASILLKRLGRDMTAGKPPGLVAEWQILFDTINIGWSNEHCIAQRPAALGTLALKQMASARASAQHFAGAGYFESFSYALSGFNASGTPHIKSLSSTSAKHITRSRRVMRDIIRIFVVREIELESLS
jgi:hypothetical protein